MKRPGIIVLFLSLFLISCNRNGTHYPVTDEFKKWTLFGEGSYWIYRNDSTMLIDSVFLAQHPLLTIFNEDEAYTDSYENIYLKYNSDFLVDAYISSYPGGANDFAIRFYGGGGVPVLLSYAQLNSIIDYGSGISFVLKEHLHDYVMEGNTFNEVQHTFYTRVSPKNDSFDFIMAKNVGLIKVYGTWNDTVRSWTLLRYHAVQ